MYLNGNGSPESRPLWTVAVAMKSPPDSGGTITNSGQYLFFVRFTATELRNVSQSPVISADRNGIFEHIKSA